MSPRVRLPLVEPSEPTRRATDAAVAEVQDGYADFMLGNAERIGGPTAASRSALNSAHANG